MNKWTSREISYLMMSYESLGPRFIAQDLGRTMKSVSRKARSIGLYRGTSQANKERANHWLPPQTFHDWTYELGYVVGVYLGDGNIYIKPNSTAYFKLDVIDKDFSKAVEKFIRQITGFDGSIKNYKDRWVYRFCNKDFVYWLRDEFGGPHKKRIKLLSNDSANKGMIEGLFDSEGTVDKYRYRIRMSGNLNVIKTICGHLNISYGPLHQGITQELWQKSPDFQGYSISNKEYTKAGLGTYIKRKAINGIQYKAV